MASTQMQKRRAVCPTHGRVEATREVPRVQFPFIVYGVRRLLAGRRPFSCPMCGQDVPPA